MQTYNIEVIYMQETHRKSKEYFITDHGYLIIMSGDKQNTAAGVGFMIAPELRKVVYSFDCFNARIAGWNYESLMERWLSLMLMLYIMVLSIIHDNIFLPSFIYLINWFQLMENILFVKTLILDYNITISKKRHL